LYLKVVLEETHNEKIENFEKLRDIIEDMRYSGKKY